MGMTEAAPGQPEMIQPVIERLAGNRDGQFRHIGKIRKAHAAGFMHLSEDHLLFFTVNGPPTADAALNRPANAFAELGVASHHLLENCDGTNAGSGLEHGHNLGVENTLKRVRAAPAARCRLLRRQPWVFLNAIGRGRADGCLCRANGDTVGLAKLHVEPHLVIGYVAAGQGWFSQKGKTAHIPTDR